MASLIDPTVIVDNQKVVKSDVRTQFTTAKNEITALQNAVRMPRIMAFDTTKFNTI